MEITQKKLKNNLNVTFVHQPGAQGNSVQMWFRAGSSLESKGDEGIAHFLEHMFFKGTEKRPGALIAREVETHGGEINAFTSFDYTCYYINSPHTQLNNTVEILMDMVSNPKFDEEELVPERGVVWEEYRRSQDNPNQFSFQKIQESCFTKGYAHPILGHEQTIKTFKREQLTSFRTKFYNQQNAMLVIAGDLNDKKKLEGVIEAYSIPSGQDANHQDFKLKDSPKISSWEKDVRLVQTTMILQAPDYERLDGAAQDLALNALGYGESSPMYQTLVAKNALCSGANASTMFLTKNGTHFIRLTCPAKNVEKAYKEFSKLIKDVLKEGIKETDINKIKNQYIASKVYEKESLESFAFGLGHGFAQNGDIHCEDQFIENIKACDAKLVNQALKDVFTSNMHITIQAPNGTDLKKLEGFATKNLSVIKDTTKAITTKAQKIKPSSKFDPNVKVVELKKGIKLVHRHNTMTPTFNMYAFIKGGLSSENKKTNSSFHLISRLLTKGNSEQTHAELKKETDTLSSSISGFSGKNAFGLQMHGLSEHSNRLFDIFFNSMLTPTMSSSVFQMEKKQVLRALETHEEDPTKHCFRIVYESLFKGHAYELNLIGTKQSVKSQSVSELKSLYKKHLSNKEIVITYCGSKTISEVNKLLEPYLKQLKPRTPKKTIKKKLKPVKVFNNHKTFDREQTQIFIGKRGYAYGTKNDVYLKMLSSYLGGQSSELFVDVRDRHGLCYVVQPIHFSALEGGFWGVYMASGHDKTEKAIEAINAVIKKYATNGFNQKEFDRIKNMNHGQDLLNLQTNDDYAQIYSIPVLHGMGLDLHYLNQEVIKKAKLEDFNKFVQNFLKGRFIQVTVGKDF